eukprot:3109581-Prymnesium_polylepis.1
MGQKELDRVYNSPTEHAAARHGAIAADHDYEPRRRLMEELDDAKKEMEAATRTITALEAQRELDHTDHLRSVRDAATAEQVKASHATQKLEAQFGALQAEMQA